MYGEQGSVGRHGSPPLSSTERARQKRLPSHDRRGAQLLPSNQKVKVAVATRRRPLLSSETRRPQLLPGCKRRRPELLPSSKRRRPRRRPKLLPGSKRRRPKLPGSERRRPPRRRGALHTHHDSILRRRSVHLIMKCRAFQTKVRTPPYGWLTAGLVQIERVLGFLRRRLESQLREWCSCCRQRRYTATVY